MSDRELVIQVTSGEGEPPAMRATPGREVGPVSVGAAGAWRLSAPGVADKHAYLFYDGKRLYLQSCSSDLPALVDGVPVPLDWTPVDAPCEIAMGTARLSFAEYEAMADYADSASELGESDVASYVSDDSYSSPSAYSNGSARGAEAERPEITDDSGVTRIEDITERSRNAAAVQAAGGTPSATPPSAAPPSATPPSATPPSATPPSATPSGAGAEAAHGMLADDGEAPTRIHGDLPSGPSMSVVGHRGMAIPASVRAAAASAAGGASSSQGAYPASVVIQPGMLPPTPAVSPPPPGGYPGGPPSSTGPIPPVSYPGWSGTQHMSGAVPPAPSSSPSGAPSIGPPSGPSSFGQAHGESPQSGPPNAGPPQSAQAAYPGQAHPGQAHPGQQAHLSHGPPSMGTPAGPAALGPPTASGGIGQAKSFWREASTPKKVTLLMMPLVVMSVGVIFSDNPRGLLGFTPVGAPARPTATTSASAPSAAVDAPPEGEASPGDEEQTPDPTTSKSSDPAQPEVETPAKSADPVAAAPPPPPPKKQDSPKKTNGEKTLERRATDAVARGQFKEAAALYDELAAKHPERQVFREAAEILRLKAANQ